MCNLLSIKQKYDTVPLDDGTAIRVLWGTRTGDFGMEAEFSTSEHDWEGGGGIASHTVGNIVFSGVGYLPISEGFDLYGKAGLNLWNTTVDVLGTSYDGDDGVGIALGGGLDFAASEQFHIRLEYQMLPGIEDGIDEGDVTQMTVSGTYFY